MKKIIIFITILVLVFSFFIYQFWNNSKQNLKADSSLSDIKKRGKLVVGTNVPFKPMEYYDNFGNLVGFDIDLIHEIASVLGVSVEIENVPWDELLNDVKINKFDVAIDSITITPERQKELLFSLPYLNAGQTVVVRKDNQDISKLENLKGKKICVLQDTTSEEVARLYTDPSMVQGFASQDLLTEHLKNKNTDAMIVDYIVAMNVVKDNPDLKIAIKLITEEYYGISTKLGNESLINAINNIVKEMKRDGRMKKIEEKWLK